MKKLMRKPIGEITIGQYAAFTVGSSLLLGLAGWLYSSIRYGDFDK